jgi:hypothetical protein
MHAKAIGPEASASVLALQYVRSQNQMPMLSSFNSIQINSIIDREDTTGKA